MYLLVVLLVRFMADPSLKPGKFVVFAENVDGNVLDQLRNEERAFLRVALRSRSSNASAAQFCVAEISQNHSQSQPSQFARFADNATPEVLGDLLVRRRFCAMLPDLQAQGAIPAVSAASPPRACSSQLKRLPNRRAIPTAAPVPMTSASYHALLDAQLNGAGVTLPHRKVIPRKHGCYSVFLIDRQSGRSYRVEAPLLVASALRQTLFLRDPNVSRSLR